MKMLWRLFYTIVARNLPASYSPVKIFQKQLRYISAKGFCESVGKNVNIEKGAVFSSKLRIGDNSWGRCLCKYTRIVYHRRKCHDGAVLHNLHY